MSFRSGEIEKKLLRPNRVCEFSHRLGQKQSFRFLAGRSTAVACDDEAGKFANSFDFDPTAMLLDACRGDGGCMTRIEVGGLGVNFSNRRQPILTLFEISWKMEARVRAA
jgi:hypothetical protein